MKGAGRDEAGGGGPGRTRRLIAVAAAIGGGLVLGVGIYLAWQVLTVPAPRETADWTRLADMPRPRGEIAVAVAGDRLYVLGGLTGLEFAATDVVSVFDAAAGTWADGPPLPEARHHAAAAAIGGDVYLSGGAASIADGAPRADLWVLRAGSTAWKALAPMPEGRSGHRMVAVDGRLYVVGGVGATPPPAGMEPGAVLVYDPGTGTWSTGAPLPLSRDHLGAVVVSGEIWAIGGRAGGRNHARVDVYDPVADRWRDGPPLPVATSGAAEAAIDDRIVVSGGEDPGVGLIVDRHWLLDTTIDGRAAWQALEAPPLTVHGAPGADLGGRFVIAGGASRAGGQSNTAWSALLQVLTRLP